MYDDRDRNQNLVRIISLEMRNKQLQARVDELESMTFINWLTWFFFGARMTTKKPEPLYKNTPL